MKKLFLALTLFVAFYACTPATENGSSTIDSTSTDSVIVDSTVVDTAAVDSVK